jgi:hypothetical protein
MPGHCCLIAAARPGLPSITASSGAPSCRSVNVDTKSVETLAKVLLGKTGHFDSAADALDRHCSGDSFDFKGLSGALCGIRTHGPRIGKRIKREPASDPQRHPHRDLTGQIQIDCPKCHATSGWWVNGWRKVSQNGLAYLSLALKPKSENTTPSQTENNSEDVGF